MIDKTYVVSASYEPAYITKDLKTASKDSVTEGGVLLAPATKSQITKFFGRILGSVSTEAQDSVSVKTNRMTSPWMPEL